MVMGHICSGSGVVFRCASCKMFNVVSVSMMEKIRTVGNRFDDVPHNDPDKYIKDILWVFNRLSKCCADPDWKRLSSSEVDHMFLKTG